MTDEQTPSSDSLVPTGNRALVAKPSGLVTRGLKLASRVANAPVTIDQVIEVRRFETGCHLGDFGRDFFVTFSPDGKRVLACDRKHPYYSEWDEVQQRYHRIRDAEGCGPVAYVWDTETAKEVSRFAGHAHEIRSLAFSPDGKQVLTGGRDGTVRRWILETGQEVCRCKSHLHPVQSVMFYNSDTEWPLIISVGEDGTCNISSLSELDFREGTGPENRFSYSVNLGGFIGGGLTWCSPASPDGSMVACHVYKGAYFADNFIAFDPTTGDVIQRFKGDGDGSGVWGLAFSPDGKFIVSGSDATVRLWEIESGREIRRFKGHRHKVFCVAYSSDGKRILSGSHETVRLWDVLSGKEICAFQRRPTRQDAFPWTLSVAFSPDGRYAVTGGEGGGVSLWSLPK